MSSSSLHESSGHSAEEAHRNNAPREDPPPSVRITVVVQNRFAIDTRRVTGRQIKETATIPLGFALYRRTQSGNEPIRDDAQVELRNGDHFFARPSSNAS
jgi:hypothetical protein